MILLINRESMDELAYYYYYYIIIVICPFLFTKPSLYRYSVLVLVYTVHVLIKIITIAGSAIRDCWWFLTTTMFTLVGRISKQWKSRLGDKHTNFKKHPDHPRRVYFLFTLVITRHGNPQSLVTVWDAFPKKKLFLWLWSDRRRFFNCVHTTGPYPGIWTFLQLSNASD